MNNETTTEAWRRVQEAGATRRAAKKVEAVLPEIIIAARASGIGVVKIARELDVTESYVYRVLREHAGT